MAGTAGTVSRLSQRGARVSGKTLWHFVEIETSAGLRGTGEASLQGQAPAVAAEIARLAPAVSGGPAGPEALARLPAPKTLAEAAARSAVDLALRDVAAQAAGQSLAEALGGAHREEIALYANINRRTEDRSPAGFAASAGDAMAAGFTAFKIAPFDGVTAEALAKPGGHAGLEPGLARIAAVRQRIGHDADLMVDCHWRLDEAAALQVLRAVEPLRLHWLECPLPETADNVPALVRLRHAANARGMKLAGCEQAIGLDGFLPFLDAGAYDTMMPDVKYVGGLAEVQRVADAFAAAGVDFSPHNPSGPICHAASLHVSAATAGFSRLELQFDESPLFDALVGGGLPRIAGGAAGVPRGKGLGVALQRNSTAYVDPA